MTEKTPMQELADKICDNTDYVLDLFDRVNDEILVDEMEGDWNAESWGARRNGEALEMWVNLYEFGGDWQTFNGQLVAESFHSTFIDTDDFTGLGDGHRAMVHIYPHHQHGDEFPRVVITVGTDSFANKDDIGVFLSETIKKASGESGDDYEGILALDKVNIDLDTSGNQTVSSYKEQIRRQILGRFADWWYQCYRIGISDESYRNNFLMTFRDVEDKTVLAFGEFSLLCDGNSFSIMFVDPEGGFSSVVGIEDIEEGIDNAIVDMLEDGLGQMVWDYIEG